jgi:hypothetical protein
MLSPTKDDGTIVASTGPQDEGEEIEHRYSIQDLPWICFTKMVSNDLQRHYGHRQTCLGHELTHSENDIEGDFVDECEILYRIAIVPLQIIGHHFGETNPGQLSWLAAVSSSVIAMLTKDNIAMTDELTAASQLSCPGFVSPKWCPMICNGTMVIARPAGRLGDLYGHRNMLLFGWVFFGLSSLLIGFSNWVNMPFMDFCRAMQGIGSAINAEKTAPSVNPEGAESPNIENAMSLRGVGG